MNMHFYLRSLLLVHVISALIRRSILKGILVIIGHGTCRILLLHRDIKLMSVIFGDCCMRCIWRFC